uniref:Conserved secreted protein n=1 Tax=Angiostrongylus cantonensis TaxID=6313 RepID=A0A0K0DDJ4_ANGCA
MSTVLLVCVMLGTITVIFLGCCLMFRFMHRSLGSEDIKHTNTLPCENVVIHPKRVYEIQAEEGCFSSLPNIAEALNLIEDVDYAPRLKRPETGDLKAIRQEHECCEFNHMAKRKARTVESLLF